MIPKILKRPSKNKKCGGEFPFLDKPNTFKIFDESSYIEFDDFILNVNLTKKINFRNLMEE
jgi:hypothetical protein